MAEPLSITMPDGVVVRWNDRVVALNGAPGQRVPDDVVYVGRKLTLGGWLLPETTWANPHKVKELGRDEALRRYYADVRATSEERLRTWLEPLRGKRLGCFCHVLTKTGRVSSKAGLCHADVIRHIMCELWPPEG